MHVFSVYSASYPLYLDLSQIRTNMSFPSTLFMGASAAFRSALKIRSEEGLTAVANMSVKNCQ